MLTSFSGRFSLHGGRDGYKGYLLSVQKSPWKKDVFSDSCGKCPKRTLLAPSLSHCLFPTKSLAKGRDVSLLAHPEVVCTPDGRGQGQLHPVTWTELDYYRRGEGRVSKGKLDRHMFTIDRVY